MTIPNFLRGRHLTGVSIIPQIVGAGGVLTAVTASTLTLTGVIDSVRLSMSPVMSDVNAVNSPYVNNIIEADDSSIVLTEILRNGDSSATPVNLLANFAYNYDVCQVSFTRGGRAWSMYGIRGAFSDGVTQRGKNVAELTLHQVDVGTATPSLQYT